MQTKQNLGRTMLEMLGVLTIIGILSITSLYIFKIAINSHKANVILNDVRMMAGVVLQKETISAGEYDVISTAEYKPETSYEMYASVVNEDRTFAVNVLVVEEGVCESLLNKAGDKYSITVFDGSSNEDEGNLSTGSDTDICKDENKMVFLFDLTGLCPPLCPDCCYGICCADDEICYEDTHTCGPVCEAGKKPVGNMCCPETTISVCGTNCCDGEMSCCAGKCCPSGECSDFESGECCEPTKMAFN